MREVFSVTELNGQIKQLLEASFDLFWVEGEVSNLSRPASGHLYFTLKDENSQIRAVIFRSAVAKRPLLRTGALFALENGMSILCRARLSVYQPRGEYQLLIDNIEPLGIGALQKAFEQLKARLQAEGLFDPVHKKKIPPMPRRIGVITSPTGAVIRDILNITRRRFPSVDILIAPVRVQGIEASGEIIRALADMHSHGGVDVIILARGGGSLEDLAPFNEEGMARAIFNSPVPVISAVGHETDFTIADFVADLRAPTPSAAAELVVPVRADIRTSVESMRLRLINHLFRLMEKFRETALYCTSRLPVPRRQIADLRLNIDARLNRMQTIFSQRQTSLRQKLFSSDIRLHQLSPIVRIGDKRLILETVSRDIIASCRGVLEDRKKCLEAGVIMLDTLSPLAVLRRGYSIAKLLPDGLILKDVEYLVEGSNVDVTLAMGGFQAAVTKIHRSKN